MMWKRASVERIATINNNVHAKSPYALDTNRGNISHSLGYLKSKKVFFDGTFNGDYSLAIVNRNLARALIAIGVNLTLFTTDSDWQEDTLLSAMPDVKRRMVTRYPSRGSFDIHFRNTWPPRASDMVGRFNAYVCYAWEELEFPTTLAQHFNTHLDLVMVTSNFVALSLRHSGVRVPVEVVGNGCDHILTVTEASNLILPRTANRRLLHVSSCFPRKGADVLVDTFVDTYGSQDGIELIIKTFPNPHNKIEATVAEARARRLDPPPIHVMMRHLDLAEMVALYKTADALVVPTRGEGFGLPQAESMLLEIPVITTAYGGQSDFCDEQTAFIVDHHLVPSATHLSGSFGLWADPSRASLKAAMQDVLTRPEEVKARKERAKARVSLFFNWKQVAERVVLAVDRTTRHVSADLTLPPKSIDLVSTWNQRCGIATYSRHLFDTDALSPLVRTVFARRLFDEATVQRPHDRLMPDVQRVWSYDFAGVRALAAKVASGRSPIFWLQHHPGFFSGVDMSAIVEALARSQYGLKVITLHNVRDTLVGAASWIHAFDIVFVHGAVDASELSARGVKNPVVLPHGVMAPRNEPSSLPTNHFVVGTFGFLQPHKNVPALVQAVAIARRVMPNLRLRLLTAVGANQSSRLENILVEATIEQHDLGDAVDKDFQFLDEDTIIEQLAACHVLAFPYGDSNETATGAARMALSADRPVLISESPVLADLRTVGHVLRSTRPEDIAEAIIVLSVHQDLLSVYDEERRALVRELDHESIARRHLFHLLNAAEKANIDGH